MKLPKFVLPDLVAAARIRRAAATTGIRRRAGGGPVRGFSRAEDGKLQRVALARALRAIDFLPGGHHDSLVARVAIVAHVFVNRHRSIPSKFVPCHLKKQLPPAWPEAVGNFQIAAD